MMPCFLVCPSFVGVVYEAGWVRNKIGKFLFQPFCLAMCLYGKAKPYESPPHSHASPVNRRGMPLR
jgi:hypothetical protein